MTGRDDAKPVAAVAFEWAHENPEALAYGFAKCQSTGKRKILALTMERFEIEEMTFHDCGSFDVSKITDIDFDDAATQAFEYPGVRPQFVVTGEATGQRLGLVAEMLGHHGQ